MSQNLCVLRPYANKTVMEGFIEIEHGLDITKEESDDLMTKVIVTQTPKCCIIILILVYDVDQ